MKIAIGIVFVLLIVGLSGCLGGMSVNEVLINKLKYDGEKITVDGYYAQDRYYTERKLFDESGISSIGLDYKPESMYNLKDNTHITVTGVFTATSNGGYISVESYRVI